MAPTHGGATRVRAPIAVILAGGRSQRMHGQDKGRLELCGKRLVDRVIERLRPQAARLILSGSHDYETGLEYIPDLPGTPDGPAAGIRSVYLWLAAQAQDAEEFVTVPVDGPFLPGDLAARLCAGDGSAIATDGRNDHPTFACWKVRDLTAAWPRLLARPRVSLKGIAATCAARRVLWADRNVFVNVNSPVDLDQVRRLADRDSTCRRP